MASLRRYVGVWSRSKFPPGLPHYPRNRQIGSHFQSPPPGCFQAHISHEYICPPPLFGSPFVGRAVSSFSSFHRPIPVISTERHDHMVHATIRLDLTPGSAREALEVLRPVAERTRIESGCVSCRLYRDVQQDHAIMIEEYWTSPEDLQSHLRSSDYQRVLLVVEMAKGHPEIKFEEVVRTAGFETIAEARSRLDRIGTGERQE